MLRSVDNFNYPPRCSTRDVRPSHEHPGHLCENSLAGFERLHDRLRVVGVPVEPGHEENANRWYRARRSSFLTQASALTRYGVDQKARAPVCSAVRRPKYDRNQSLTRTFAESIGEPLPLAERHYDLVTRVALTRARLGGPGLNQAAWLHVPLTRQVGSRLDAGSLIRTRAISVPTAKDRQESFRNVHKAFRIRRPARITNRRMLPPQHVMTTAPPSLHARRCCARLVLDGSTN